MKKLSLFVFLLIASCSISYAQTEFKTNKNGLMYSETTMNQLKYIVDSLNLKFKVCELEREYRSTATAMAHYVSLNNPSSAVQRDMLAGISLEAFLQKYPSTVVTQNLLVRKYHYTRYDGDDVVEFYDPLTEKEISIHNQPDLLHKKVKNQWVYENSKNRIYGFFFYTEFETQPMQEKYARQIQYSDCLIDTTASIFSEKPKQGNVNLPDNYQELSLKTKQALLKKMRNTQVVGFCSQDDSPRIHARNIAILAAETVEWSIFLRAHLNIMNDRFDRMSDGSYAWAGRKTYIKELEELDINVQDLLFGITLRIDNPSDKHYYSDIGRIGRALSESEDLSNTATNILNMIQDKSLDDYNRLLMYYLFTHFNHHLKDKKVQEANKTKLAIAINTMPEYMSKRLKEGK